MNLSLTLLTQMSKNKKSLLFLTVEHCNENLSRCQKMPDVTKMSLDYSLKEELSALKSLHQSLWKATERFLLT